MRIISKHTNIWGYIALYIHKKKPFIHKKMSFLHQNIHSDATSHLFQFQQNIQSKGNKNSAKFHLMPKKFCGFCKVFCSKKIAEIRKIFQKNIFSSKNLSKNFGFFIDFSLFHLSKSANFCHLHQFFTATFPISHPNTTPQLFAKTPKHHTSSYHPNTTLATYTCFNIIPALSSLSSLFSLTAINILFI